MITLPILVLGSVACTSNKPVQHMVLADVALKSALKSKADSLVPDLYREAENYYLRAKKDYGEGYFDSAMDHATRSRQAAEKAEFEATLRQAQIRSGRNKNSGGY